MIRSILAIAVVITCDDIYILISWIPVHIIGDSLVILILIVTFRSPDPNQVIHALLLEGIIHQFPEFLELNRTIRSPPEPRFAGITPLTIVTTSLMKRTPDNRDTLCLKSQEIIGNDIQVALYAIILPSTVSYSSSTGERGLLCIERIRRNVVNLILRCRNIPVPHAFYDTIVVIPVLYYACVGIVYPTRTAQWLTVVEVNEVETVECRILACEFIHLLCILRIPVYISHRTGKGLLSEILHQVSIELLGCLCSIGVTQVRSNVKQFCIPVVVSTGRETECILRSEIIRTVTHRRLHDLNLIIRGSLCMQRNN